jgi:hypothetical protein
MPAITIEISNELAAQLSPIRYHLPALLHEVLKSRSAQKTAASLKSGDAHPGYREMFDFLASGPTPEQIIAHRPSASLQERVAELLEKHREEGLTKEEAAELDGYEQVDDLMSLLKARARIVIP